MSVIKIEAFEIVPLFGIDSLHACVPADIEAYEIMPVFCIESLWVVPGLIRVWKQFYE